MSATTATSASTTKKKQEEQTALSLSSLTKKQIQAENWGPVLLLEGDFAEDAEFIFAGEDVFPSSSALLTKEQFQRLVELLDSYPGVLKNLVKVRPQTLETAILFCKLLAFLGLGDSKKKREERFDDWSKFSEILISVTKLKTLNDSLAENWSKALCIALYNLDEKPYNNICDPTIYGEKMVQSWLRLAAHVTSSTACAALSKATYNMMCRSIDDPLVTSARKKLWTSKSITTYFAKNFSQPSIWQDTADQGRFYLCTCFDLTLSLSSLETLSSESPTLLQNLNLMRKNGNVKSDDEKGNKWLLQTEEGLERVKQIQKILTLDSVSSSKKAAKPSSSSSSSSSASSPLISPTTAHRVACMVAVSSDSGDDEETDQVLKFFDAALFERLRTYRPTSQDEAVALVTCISAFVPAEDYYPWQKLFPSIICCSKFIKKEYGVGAWSQAASVVACANFEEEEEDSKRQKKEKSKKKSTEEEDLIKEQEELAEAFSSLCTYATTRRCCEELLLCLNCFTHPSLKCRAGWIGDSVISSLIQLTRLSLYKPDDEAMEQAKTCLFVLCNMCFPSCGCRDPSLTPIFLNKLAASLELVLWRLPELREKGLLPESERVEENEDFDEQAQSASDVIDASDLGKLSRQHALLTVFRIAEKSSKSSSIGNVFDSIWAIKICTLRFLLAERKK